MSISREGVRMRFHGKAGIVYTPGRVAVIFKNGAFPQSSASGLVRFGNSTFTESRRLNFSYIGRSASVLSVTPGTESQVVAQLAHTAGVLSASQVRRAFRAGIPPAPLPINDPYFPVQPLDGTYVGQWDMHFASADLAWGFNTQGSPTLGTGVTIAIIDTGVDVTHPDVSAKIAGTFCSVTGATNPGAGDGTQSDGINQPVSDLDGHGTNVAGIAAASSNQNPAYGFSGMGYNSSIYAYKVFPNPPAAGCQPGSNDPACTSDTSDIANALNDIASRKTAKVANLSLGEDGTPGTADLGDPTLYAAVQNAQAAGIVLVAASGNEGYYPNSGNLDGSTPLDLPAAYPGVIAVGATALNDTAPYSPTAPGQYVASYSNSGTGSAWGLVAPGGDPIGSDDSDYLHWIEQDYSSLALPSYTCDPGIGNSTNLCRILIAGTSQATPHVSGTVALLLGAGANPSTVFSTLCNTADQNANATPLVPPVEAGRPSTATGCGALNAYRAMAVTLGYADPGTPGGINQ